MRIVWSAALAIVLGVGSAAAEPPSTEDSFAPSLRELDLAVGVNVPLGWSGANSVGASAYLGIGNHHALRANFASYVNTNLRAQDLAAFLLHPSEFLEGDDVLIHSGRITDVGLGWVF